MKKHRKRSTEDVIADIRKQIESTQPALRVDFGQVIGDMLGDLMTSVQPIEIKIFGDDQQKLKELSTQVADISSKVNGVADVFDGVVIAGPSISVLPEYARLAQYGITPANFQSQIQIALQGTISGNVLEKEQLTNIRLIYPNSRQLDINSMKKLPIFLPNGQLKPADELAAINITTGESEIQRENLQSMGVVTARLDNRDLGSAVQEIKRGVDRSVQLPQGYHIVYGGSYAQQQQSFHELLLILIASALLVFSVILFLFRNIAVAALIVLVAILGISGSYVALFLTNTPLNVGSYTGLIMIIGIIGENAIFTFLQFRDALSSNSVKDAVIFSISARLRPKLMTALGAIIALMPLALGIGTGAQLHQPLAIAVIGGFLSALILLLVVLPTFLMLLFKNHKKADTDTTN